MRAEIVMAMIAEWITNMDVNNEIINSEATICVNLKNYQFHNRDYILVKGQVLWSFAYGLVFSLLLRSESRNTFVEDKLKFGFPARWVYLKMCGFQNGFLKRFGITAFHRFYWSCNFTPYTGKTL